jgi:hypothetical protein
MLADVDAVFAFLTIRERRYQSFKNTLWNPHEARLLEHIFVYFHEKTSKKAMHLN